MFDNYHKRRLMDLANCRSDQKLQSDYAKFVHKSDISEIIQRSEYEFKVTSPCLTDIYNVTQNGGPVAACMVEVGVTASTCVQWKSSITYKRILALC